MKTVLTYGTFDLFHHGHLELLRRAHELSDGGTLIVGLSSDEFNQIKGKSSHFDYDKRAEMVGSVRYVDMIIPEHDWDQKRHDIIAHKVDVFVIGDDWKGSFDGLRELCEVVYLPRTPDISSTAIKKLAPKNDDGP